MTNDILTVDNLEKHFPVTTNPLKRLLGGETDYVQAVDGVSFDISEEQVMGVIGESGCGKSTLLRTLVGLETPNRGEVLFRGTPMSEFSKSDWKSFRRDVQIIFQDPFNSLDPKLTVRESIREPLIVHGFDDIEARIDRVLKQVKLNPPERYKQKLPGGLSGGEKQRAAIARSLVIEPSLLLADEPVSMLDVSTQAAMLNLLSELVDDMGMAMLYISHDISTVVHLCEMTNVMYLGRFVETATAHELIRDPKHPYTQALVNSIPIPDTDHPREHVEIQGSAPDPINIGEGCRFRDRCPERMDICEVTPRNVELSDDQTAACHLYYDHEDTAVDSRRTESVEDHAR